MGKASRRKREHLAEAKPCDLRKADEPEGQKSPHSLFGRLMRRPLTYAVGGAIALGGWFASEHTSFTAATPHCSLQLVFLNHGDTNSAERFVEEIDSAEAAGKPFSIMFAENAGQQDTHYMERVINMNRKFAVIRNNYLTLRKWGYGEKEAEAKARTMTHISTGNPAEEAFMQYVFTAAGAHGLKLMPLESISAQALKDYDESYAHNREVRKRVDAQIKTNTTLEELAASEMELEASFLKLNDSRNAQVANGLPERFRQALDAFPELRREAAEGKELRAIGYMGYEHSPFFYGSNLTNGTVSLVPERIKDDQFPIMERIIDSMASPRQFTKREALLIALQEMYVGPAVKYLGANGRAQTGQTLIDNAMTLGEAQLEKLDGESAAIPDPRQRAGFVLNSLLGSRYFTLFGYF